MIPLHGVLFQKITFIVLPFLCTLLISLNLFVCVEDAGRRNRINCHCNFIITLLIMSRLGFPILVLPRVGGIGFAKQWASLSPAKPSKEKGEEGIPTQLCEISTAILPTVKDYIKEFHYSEAPSSSSVTQGDPDKVRGKPASHQKAQEIPLEEKWLGDARQPRTPFPFQDKDVLEVWLRVGRLVAPVTILGEALLGERPQKQTHPHSCLLAAHTYGLPGAFVFPLDHLRYCRSRILLEPSPSLSMELGNMCLLEAVRWNLQCHERRGTGREELFVFDSSSATTDNFFDNFYRLARRRHFSLLGLEHMMQVGSEINTEALELSFPYHCGGEQASKKYFDILPDAIEMFHGGQTSEDEQNSASLPFVSRWEHGTKVLSRYGVAVCVGVRPHISSLGMASDGHNDYCRGGRPTSLLGSELPTLFWHPTGAPAACIAPILHCRVGTTVVGKVGLEYNGPGPGSPLLHREIPSRYLLQEEESNEMNRDDKSTYDQMGWLHKTLFGVQPKQEWRGWQSFSRRESLLVHGIRWNPSAEGELELYLRGERNGDVFPAADI